MNSLTLCQVLAFQFHKGAIRTYMEMFSNSYLLYFNSIKVRLEHLFSLFIARKAANFNSIKVRLEPIHHSVLLAVVIFQFHKGAIRTIRN